MRNFWDERYDTAEFVYGESPNTFFAKSLKEIKPGILVLPCEGEGRNAVYAASIGWNVKAFDLSEVGKQKAEQFALNKGVRIDYQITDATTATYPDNSIDAVALVFAHLPKNARSIMHENIKRWLKPGGILIAEMFSPNQLHKSTGGPKDIEMLYTIDLLKKDFEGFTFSFLEDCDIELDEGVYHNGPASVIRMLAIK